MLKTGAAKTKILIVDDEPDLLLMLQKNFEALGYTVMLANEGATALRRILDDSPDLVILDVLMPLVDGWAVLEMTNTLEPRPKTFVLSCKTGQENIDHAFALGAEGYMTKPFNMDELKEKVQALLQDSPPLPPPQS